MHNFPTLNNLGKTQEFIIKSRYPSFHKFLVNNYPKELSWPEKLYWYYYNTTSKPKCEMCGKDVKFISFVDGYRKYCCKKCSANDPSQKESRVKTNIMRYGASTPLSSNEVKEKIKQTNLERYGVENPMKCEKIQNKVKQTNLERYGVENPFSSEEVKEKIKQTNLERYGVENPTKNSIIYNKIEQTNIDKYGVKNPSLSQLINDKKSKSLRQYHLSHMLYKDVVIEYNDEGNWICKCPHTKCNKCESKTFEIYSGNYLDRVRVGVELCTKLNPIQQNIQNKNTSIEIFIKNILDEYNIDYECNNRNILKPLELDIYIPSKKLAIECNGIKWHSDKEPKYHMNKYLECLSHDIQLLTFWEDQIKLKPDVVRSILLSKLGLYDEKIYARKCIVKEISSNECVNFLLKNHIQGKTNSNVKLGLYYNDRLVSVMTFKHINKYYGQSKIVNEWNLNRFCTTLNTQVIGGASKLLKYFIKKFNPDIIISYSSNDVSNGKLYNSLGFTADDKYTTAYWYIHKNTLIRKHRTSFSKSELRKKGYDIKDKTESEIMSTLNYYRIFDCGHKKYVLKDFPNFIKE